MKQGKSLTELAAELTRQAQTKKDYVADSRALSLCSNGHTVLNTQGGSWELGETAHDQLATKLNIPKKYYDKLRTEAPALLDLNANHWLQKQPEKILIRTLDNKARAILSDRYRPLDNYDLAETALPVLQNAGCNIVSCEVTEKRFYLKATTPKLNYDLKKNDIVEAGIVISNSEIGYGSLSISAMLYRLVCTNGMILPEKIRKNHVGRANEMFEGTLEYFKDETRIADDKAFWMKVRDSISSFFIEDRFLKFVERFKNAQQDTISKDPIEMIELAQKTFLWNDSERTGVLKHLLGNGDLTRFGLANAVTRQAQDLESYDRATEFETLGGQIIELPKTQWESLAA